MSGAGVRARLTRIFRAAVAAADPVRALRREVRRAPDGALSLAGEAIPPSQPLHVLALGKAAAPMARALEQIAGSRLARGLAITRRGDGAPLERCAQCYAAHPVPDGSSAEAGRAALRFAAEVPRDAVLLVLLSGGASSLTTCPVEGLDLPALAATTRALLASGAPIDELNAVRKHLSAVSGGRLARASQAARLCVLAVSDVAGDRFDVIGSGPCAPDPSRYADALAVLAARCPGAVPSAVRDHLEAGARGERPETPKPGDPCFAQVRHVLLASSRTALDGARAAAQREGQTPVLVTDALAGEARLAGTRLAALCRAVRASRPLCLLGAGETTVTVRGDGKGGRSQELCLAAALGLDGVPGVALLAAGTDGIDGPTDAAGAFADGDTLARARARGLDPQAALERNDAYPFFDAIDGLLRTGPTGTNVRDLVLLSVTPGLR